jgi:hypothetical protein|tara:strand:- start:1272 stop:1775 length:504 start_codon:yes stop_codon:yes gene_type:complete
MTDTDLAYLAGLIDGEGYIGIKKIKPYRCQGRTTPGYTPRIQVRMVDSPGIQFLAETLGGWTYTEKPSANNGRPLECFQASDRKAEAILKAVYPYLRIKKEQARTALVLARLKRRSPRHRTKITGYRDFHHRTGKTFKVPNKTLSDQYVAWCDSLWLKCKALNRVGR